MCIRDRSQANTWKKYSFTVPGCPDGTWEKTNSAGLQVQISHSMGTTYHTSTLRQWITTIDVSPTTQVNWMATVGNTWYITGLQVEEGTVATEFEHRPISEEIALCQRYYGKIRLANQEWIYNESSTSNHKWHWVNIPFTMRDNPTIDSSDLTMGGSVSGLSGTLSSYTAQRPGDTPGRISARVGMTCLLYTSPSPRDLSTSRMPSSA